MQVQGKPYINQTRLRKLRMRVEVDAQLMPGSKKLRMRGRELDSLPPELYCMTDLEVLDLSPERQSCIDYHLTEVPAAISRLENLKVLMLDTNKITHLPDSIGQLKHLERLSLSNNRLSRLPEDFGLLRSLQSLHMANNEFEVFPEVVCSLEDLRFLDICDNMLSRLPDAIRRLGRLESLLVCMNCLPALPDAICELSELRTLWLGDNNLSRLPRMFAKLRRLDWGGGHTSSSVVDNNPLKHPPIYVCKQGVAAIDDYFKVAEPQKAVPFQKKAENKGK